MRQDGIGMTTQDLLKEDERLAMLQALDEFIPIKSPRSQDEVERELTEVREPRRSGGRRATVHPHAPAPD